MVRKITKLFPEYIHKAKMSNNAIFEFKTWDFTLTRKEIIKQILNIANGSYGEIYTKNDIEYIWKTKY